MINLVKKKQDENGNLYAIEMLFYIAVVAILTGVFVETINWGVTIGKLQNQC